VPVPRADGGESVHSMPDLRLSEEAFPSSGAAVEDVDDVEVVADAEDEIVEGSLTVEETSEPAADETPEPEPAAEAEHEAEAEPAAEAEPEAEVEAEAPAEDEPAARADAEVVAEAADEPEPEADSAES